MFWNKKNADEPKDEDRGGKPVIRLTQQDLAFLRSFDGTRFGSDSKVTLPSGLVASIEDAKPTTPRRQARSSDRASRSSAPTQRRGRNIPPPRHSAPPSTYDTSTGTMLWNATGMGSFPDSTSNIGNAGSCDTGNSSSSNSGYGSSSSDSGSCGSGE